MKYPLLDIHSGQNSPTTHFSESKKGKNPFHRVISSMKTCRTCRISKPLEDFYDKPSNKDKKTKDCKQCIGLNRSQAYAKHSNKAHIIAKATQWNKTHREKTRAYHCKHMAIYRRNPKNKILEAVRKRLKKVLKNNKKGFSISKSIGCTPDQLRQHIESQFKNGMSWANYGMWHIDHIKPISSFSIEELGQANHYTNLQPLWALENLRKGNQ
jgi:hypothetical protein